MIGAACLDRPAAHLISAERLRSAIASKKSAVADWNNQSLAIKEIYSDA
jgi:hypothetical protein